MKRAMPDRDPASRCDDEVDADLEGGDADAGSRDRRA